jgi:Flp pilus assembly protein TadG
MFQMRHQTMTTRNRNTQKMSTKMNRAARRRFDRRRRGGSVALTVALSMIMLCGFCALAVDYGRSVLEKNQLQRATDAGALAALAYMPNDTPGHIKQAAIYYAYQNDKVNIEGSDVELSNNNMRVRVSARRNVPFLFARVLNIFSGNVATRSTAALQQRDQFVPPNVVPIGVTPSTYNAYKDGSPAAIEGIRQNKQDLDIREFVLFDLRAQNSKSPSHMQDQLQWGSTFNEPTYIGGAETTLNAANVAQAKKFQDGMLTRFTAANGAPWYDDGSKYTNIPPGSPRVVNFIVTPEQQAVNGNNNARVIGFVPVYVESITIVGDVMRMNIRFLPLTAGGGGSYTDASTDADATSLRIGRLIS